MEIQAIILQQLQVTVEQFSVLPFPAAVEDEMLLNDFHLDSVAFTNLLVGLEQQLGFIPLGILRGIAFPETIGELIAAYENEVHVAL
jgi:acyl carrier protein